MIAPAEKDLVSRLRNGDASALKILFTAYHPQLCRLAWTLLKDDAQAKDAVQDVFIKFWKNCRNIEINHSLHAYLKRAVINTALNYLQQNNQYRHASLEEAHHHPASLNADAAHRYEELATRIQQALALLPTRTQAVFKLIRSEEMSYKEVSELLDISLKAVEKEMIRALRLLREALRDYLPVFVLSSLLG